jgi:phosphotransferase system IIB component
MPDMPIEAVIALIISSVVLVIGIITLVLLYRRGKAQSKEVSLDVSKLLEALGGPDNIEKTVLENKRLKVTLINPKLVSQTLLKNLDIAAFLSGKEIKLLIKEEWVAVKNQLDQLRNEGMK